MARDFLAIPTTSVAVERLFSSSHHLCTDLRASFKAETVTEAMCIKYGLLEAHPYVKTGQEITPTYSLLTV